MFGSCPPSLSLPQPATMPISPRNKKTKIFHLEVQIKSVLMMKIVVNSEIATPLSTLRLVNHTSLTWIHYFYSKSCHHVTHNQIPMKTFVTIKIVSNQTTHNSNHTINSDSDNNKGDFYI